MIRIRRPDGLKEELKTLRQAYDTAQEVRTQLEARLSALMGTGASRARNGEPGISGCDGLREIERNLRAEEKRLAAALALALTDHSAWSWIRQVKGLDAVLTARLLSHLDVARARTPSAFWAYCGLATVEGDAYSCSTCGLQRSFPRGARVSGEHRALEGDGDCTGRLTRRTEAEAEVRVAAAPTRGTRSTYNQAAKHLCYLIGLALLRADGSYADYYRAERDQLEETRPAWSEARRHLTALRKMEKLFLAHLWVVWREAEGLAVTEPHQEARASTGQATAPWNMVAQQGAGAA